MKKMIIILVVLIIIELILYKQSNFNSYSDYLITYNEDIIGNISLPINEDYLLVQGLDNEYYLNHNTNKEFNHNGSIFLGYETDLNRKGVNELFIPYKDNYNDYINQIITINYLDNIINYKVVNKTNNKDKLIINFFKNNNIVKTLNGIRI